MIKKNCLQCQKVFFVFPSLDRIACCSKVCSNFIKKGKSPWNKGKLWSKEIKEKIRKSSMGRVAWNKDKKVVKIADEKHWCWKGDDVGYVSLHTWIARKLGKPKKCQYCGIDNLRPRQFNWANISRQYKRDLTDWIRLCTKCHKAYDMGRISL